jgi:hypothetical protein
MPQTVTDPSATTGIITNGGTDLFSYPNVQQPSVLGLQTTATQPLPPGTATATNLLLPGQQIAAQLVNFPSNVYDTAPTSLLFHFMAALMGDAGAGQLRKRQMVARLQQAIGSTQFYDLDSFYGSLFGAQRGPSGALPTNPNTSLPTSPYTDLASPDGWDEVLAADAVFRERIIQLARAITLGGTVPGLQALAEAITGVSCLVWEAWRVIDNASGPSPGYQTWQEVVAAYPLWSDIPGSLTWQGIEGYVTFAGLNVNGVPNEVVIQPRKVYPSTVAGQQQQGADTFGVLSVVEVLKPAATMVSVNPQGIESLVPLPIAGAWADSENLEIVQVVTPSSPASDAYAPIVNSYQGPNASQLPAGSYVQPAPVMSRTSTGQFTAAGDVTSVTAQAVSGSGPNGAVVSDGQDFQTIVFSPSSYFQYLPSLGVMPPAKAASARSASAVAVRCAPYSGPRAPVMRST